MSFIRNSDDSQPFWRLNDEIRLAVSRLDTSLDRNSSVNNWPKGGDPPFIRGWDNPRLNRLPAAVTRRPEDNPVVTRLPADDYFRRL